MSTEIYKLNHKGYYYNSKTGKSLHREIYETKYGPIPKGYEIHHVDHNKLNNNPKNLIILTSDEHKKLHGFKPKIEMNLEKLFEDFKNGKSYEELSKEHNCAVSTIKRKIGKYRKQHNLKNIRKLNVPTGEQLHKEYLKIKSMKKLAEKYECDISVITYRIDKYLDTQ